MKQVISVIVLLALPVAFASAEPDIEVLKSVNNSMPVPGEPVEFTVQVTNIGDEAAPDVMVMDRLPEQMAIPEGTAAFASIGTYDPATGEWSIGSLEAGAGATLVVPALVTEPSPPACIVNAARSRFADINDLNDESRAGVYQDDAARCVDFLLTPVIFVNDSLFPQCDSRHGYGGFVKVLNYGPDAARDVSVTLTQSHPLGAGLRFDDASCARQGSNECMVAEIASGEAVLLAVTSDTFQNYTAASYPLTIAAATGDTDYDSSNDVLVVQQFVSGFSSCEPSPLDNLDLGDVGLIGAPTCFIATAAYGTALDPRLDTLRDFRDRHLLTNGPGRAFVAMYYRYSPPIADYIAERDWLRAAVRAVLTPLVHAIEHPLVALLIVVAIIFVRVLRWRHRRAGHGPVNAR